MKKSQGKQETRWTPDPWLADLSVLPVLTACLYMKGKLMCLFLCFSSAFTNVHSLNVCSSKKRKKNQVQELKTKIFVSLNPSNYLEFVNNLNFQLQPPLQALPFFGQYFIAKKYLGFIFLPKLSFIFPENVKGTSEWILLLFPVVLGQWGIVIMNKWFNSPVHPALLLLTQISKGFQDEKVIPIKAKASLAFDVYCHFLWILKCVSLFSEVIICNNDSNKSLWNNCISRPFQEK